MTEIKPCPFCGATPHKGLSKTQHDQLHGEPFQRFVIWCPHGCARIDRANEDQASAAWNTRTPDPSLIAGLREAREALAEVLSYRHGEGKYRFASLPEAERECAAFDAWQEVEAMAETTRANLDNLLSQEGQP